MGNVNITVSVDEKIVERAREIARGQGTSLDEMIRTHLERITAVPSPDDVATEFVRLSMPPQGSSSGRKVSREELYEHRIGRPRSRRS
jgi:hypothetical protein